MTLVITTFVTFFFYIYFYNRAKSNEKKCNYIHHHWFEKNSNTGDLIIIRYASFKATLVDIFSGYPYNHVGMVYKDCIDNKCYILEATAYSGTDYKGVSKVPINFWFSMHRGCNIYWMRYQGTKINSTTLDNIYQKHHGKGLNSNPVLWLKTLKSEKNEKNNKEIKLKDQDKFMCLEFIFYMLQELNVISKKYTADSYTPGELINGHIEWNEPYPYKPSLKIYWKNKRLKYIK